MSQQAWVVMPKTYLRKCNARDVTKNTVSHLSYAPLINCKTIQKRNMIFVF